MKQCHHYKEGQAYESTEREQSQHAVNMLSTVSTSYVLVAARGLGTFGLLHYQVCMCHWTIFYILSVHHNRVTTPPVPAF